MKGTEVKQMLIKIANMFIENQDYLSQLDAVIGDGDHGVTMARGAKAALEKLEHVENDSIREYFKAYGRTLVSTLGGAMGPLYGSVFLEISKAFKEVDEFTLEALACGVENAELKVCSLGGAMVGDKTMVDAMDPAKEALLEAVKQRKSLEEGLKVASEAARVGVEETKPLIAKRGRSKYLQEKAIGHQDAGATSFYLLMEQMYLFVKENA